MSQSARAVNRLKPFTGQEYKIGKVSQSARAVNRLKQHLCQRVANIRKLRVVYKKFIINALCRIFVFFANTVFIKIKKVVFPL